MIFLFLKGVLASKAGIALRGHPQPRFIFPVFLKRVELAARLVRKIPPDDGAAGPAPAAGVFPKTCLLARSMRRRLTNNLREFVSL
jgi:hypothetical protein